MGPYYGPFESFLISLIQDTIFAAIKIMSASKTLIYLFILLCSDKDGIEQHQGE